MLSVGICTYQDRNGLKRALDSVSPHVEEVLVIDGIFTDFDTGDKPKLSTDGTEELCKSYPNVRYIPYPAQQIAKRQKYLDECKTPFLMVLDTDEWITGNWGAFYDNLRTCDYSKVYSIWGDINHTRVITNPTTMEYYERHFLLKRKHHEYIPDQFQPSGITSGVVPGIRVKTDEGATRDPRLQSWIEQYQKDLMKKERVKQFMYLAVQKAREKSRASAS